MPEETAEIITPEDAQAEQRPLIDEQVTAHLLQIFGNPGQQQYVPTQAQVDKILSLQEKGMDYTHEERIKFSSKQKLELSFFGITVLVLVIVFLLTLFFAKDYLREVITGILSFVAGGAGGYGIGKANSPKNTNGD